MSERPAIVSPDVGDLAAGVPRAAPVDAIDSLEAARAQEYALLSHLLRTAPSADLLARLGSLTGDETLLGQAHVTLARAARSISAAQVADEHFQIFVGLGRGELLPYASFYMTGFLHGRPLARVRGDLADLGLHRNDGDIEPEDHLATLCEVMSGIASGLFEAPDRGLGFFDRHLAPWADRFFVDLEVSPSATFYRAVGALGRVFIEIETQAFKFDRAEAEPLSRVEAQFIPAARGQHV
ncbi:molecular chaperone [Beijerinckia sp. L45]|uniref:TorD/DmsD family molecular chaperone n=1 Tax=Beijerinckia sp. L45 TaxID=1641855 RepID=UPI00131CAE9F|nr:molecular chaperone TorD family protein [Beijerinckia sp. L45]